MARIRKIKGEPISFCMNHASPKLLGRLSAKDFKDTSFLKVFQKKCKIKFSHMEQNITAVNADIDLCDMLQVDFGAPLLFSETIYYSDKNNPIEVTHMYYRGDRYTYRATLPLTII
jgi:GntR family transcriptional regulator